MMVRVVVIDELDPNNVLIVVALKLICVPITVLDTFVPIVVVELAFADVAASVLIPTSTVLVLIQMQQHPQTLTQQLL